MDRWDIAVIGGGVLGTSVAYWLGSRFDGNIVVVEREPQVAGHASGRNTGVIHRPFYLHPVERRLFARAASLSYPIWRDYAKSRNLRWNEIGTLKVALTENQIGSLEKNMGYARANGMDPSELDLLDARGVSRIEPEVGCVAALLIKTDTVVDYKALTLALRSDCESVGVRFLTGHEVIGFEDTGDEMLLQTNGSSKQVAARFAINCAGGKAVDLAHMAGLATDYTDMHFRGEYWRVDESAAGLVSRNVYSVPRQGEFPFLDPHWIVRVDGSKEIGPNAVPVPGPFAYDGSIRHAPSWIAELFRPPLMNKANVWLNKDFLGLSVGEMWSSLSKGEMLRRVGRFIPRLRLEHLRARGTAGIRSVVIDRHGKLAKEAIEVSGPCSFHILNFNSPGATGAPAYAAYVVNKLEEDGRLEHVKAWPVSAGAWDWENAL